MTTEFITDEKNVRMVLFPLKHKDIFQLYQKALSRFWVPQELDFSVDKQHYDTLTEHERNYLNVTLIFFSISDFIVSINLGQLIEQITLPELLFAYSFNQSMENIHSESYALMLDTILKEHEQKGLRDSLLNLSSIVKKREWCASFKDKSVAEKILSLICIELLFFVSSFACIFFFRRKNLLPGITFANEQISKDENIHIQLGLLLYNKYITNKLPEERVIEIINEAFKIECEYIEECLPNRIIGINSILMIRHLKFNVNCLYELLNIDDIPHFDAKQLDFMKGLDLSTKSNFFEKGVSEYQKTQVVTNPLENRICFDANY